MNSDLNREDQALDALIAAAFRQVDFDDLDLEALKKAERFLTAEDRQVLENLGDDFVDRVTSGQWETRSGSAWEQFQEVHDDELSAAMNRGDEDDLTDAGREEMQRKLRDLEDEEEGSTDQ